MPNLRKAAVLAVVLVSLASAPGASPAGEAAPSAAERVAALWAAVDAAWNERDAEKFTSLFTNAASFRFVDRRDSLEGRVAILERFSKQFPETPPNLRHHTVVRDVRQVSNDVVTMDGTVEIVRRAPGTGAEQTVIRSFAIFAMMLPGIDGWRISVLRIYQMPNPVADD